MLPRVTEAVESLFGGALVPAARVFRATAQTALALALVLPLLRFALSFAAFRYGWETAVVVRCPKCRRLVADPDVPRCPAGHPIRFPPGAARRETRRRRFRRLTRAIASYGFLLPLGVALAAAAGFAGCGVSRVEGALATIAASAAYLFFLAALALGSLAVAPAPRGATERLLHAGTAAACLLPAVVLALSARAFEPPRPREIGSLWSTPTAVYVSTGGRARRAGDARIEMDALLVDARAPAFGIVWQGLEGFRSGPLFVKWRGRGGRTSRLLARWAAPLSRRGVYLARSTRSVPLPPNVRVWIVAEPGRIRFSTEGAFDLTRPPRAPGLLRRTG